MTNQNYDVLMTQALRLFKENQLKDIPPEEEIDYEFSQNFQKKLMKLMQKQENPVRRFFQSTGRKAAAIILALIIGFSATLSIDAVRQPIFNFFYKIFSTHTDVEFGQTENKTITTCYSIPRVPVGFTADPDTVCDEVYHEHMWINGNGECIDFTQICISSSVNSSLSIDSEKNGTKEISVNGIRTLFCDTGHSVICIWSENGYHFELVYPLNLGKEFMHEVIGKLVETDIKTE